MNLVEKTLRAQTVNLFTDEWYLKTTELLSKAITDQRGYVYIIRNENSKIVKIGKSLNLTSRLNNFKTSFGSGLILVGFFYCENYNDLENQLHKKFFDKKVSGEWFDLSEQQILDCIDENNGVFVNKYFIKESKIIDDQIFGFNDENMFCGISNYYEDFYSYLNELPKNEKIMKNEFYEKIKSLNQNYNVLSPKRVNIVLKKRLKELGINYADFNINGQTYFIIS